MATKIIVNTDLLKDYSRRIHNLKLRIDTLDTKIRTMYFNGEYTGLYYFVEKNRFANGLYKLYCSKEYLDGTISDFEWVEQYYSSLDPLFFTEGQARSLDPVNSGDAFGKNGLSLSDLYKSIWDKVRDILDQNGSVLDWLNNISADKISDFLKGDTLALNLLSAIFAGGKLPISEGDEKTLLDALSKITKGVGKIEDDKGLGMTSKIFSFLDTAFNQGEYKSISDWISQALSLTKGGIDVETSLYSYLLSNMKSIEKFKFDKKYGNSMSILSVVSKILSSADDGIDAYAVWSDPNSTFSEKLAKTMELTGSIANSGMGIYGIYLGSEKTLRVVNKLPDKAKLSILEKLYGSNKVYNQILTTQSVQYTTSQAVKDKIANFATAGTLIEAGFDGIAGMIDRCDELNDDSNVDFFDWASIVQYGATAALEPCVSALTFGLISYDSEETADWMTNKAMETYKDMYWIVESAAKTDNVVLEEAANVVVAAGSSVVAFASSAAKVTADSVESLYSGITNGIMAAGEWTSNIWKKLIN